MYKLAFIFFMTIMMVLAPTLSYANELDGKVTSLSLDEKAPYAGVLLDPIAASKMIIDQRYLRSELELELRKEFQQELSNKRLAFDLVKVEHDSLKKIHEQTILLRDQQIDDLNQLLKEEMSNDYSEWWMMGGVLTGIVLSVVVFYASVEISR